MGAAEVASLLTVESKTTVVSSALPDKVPVIFPAGPWAEGWLAGAWLAAVLEPTPAATIAASLLADGLEESGLGFPSALPEP